MLKENLLSKYKKEAYDKQPSKEKNTGFCIGQGFLLRQRNRAHRILPGARRK
jgi:hypothetical protein